MAIQFTDFSRIPTQQPAIANIFENILQGYKMQREPARMARQQEQEELANALKKLTLEEEPERFRLAQEGVGLGNALKRFELQSAPEKLRSLLDSRSGANALRNLQMQQLEMELNPEKKAAYIQSLANAFGSGSESQVGGGDDVRKALFRKAMGLPAQTPEEKNAQELELWKQKNAFKLSGDQPTTGSITQIQAQNRNIDSLIPMIDDLINFDEPSAFSLNGNLRNSYASKVNPAIDKYVGAFKLPQVKESIELAKGILQRGAFESQANYHKRLKELKNDLLRQKNILKKSFNGGGSTRVYYKGKPHMVPNDQLQAALDAGGTLDG